VTIERLRRATVLHTNRGVTESERRGFTRHPIQVAVSITTSDRHDRVGVTRDLSASGLLFHSLSRFAPGERVRLVFHAVRRASCATGEVVRATQDPDEASRLRYLTAVRFDDPIELAID
jgi:hypothetical protein